MKLSTRVLLLMLVLLLLALVGSLMVHTWAAHRALTVQLELRNRDAATALGVALSQQQGDDAALKAVAAAQFDTGNYSLVRLTRPNGELAIDMQRADPSQTAPGWFMAAWPIQVPPGQAAVTQGWRQVGRLQVAAQSAWAHTALWEACRNTATLLVGLGVLAALLAGLVLNAWQQPVRVTVNQARALENGRFVEADEPSLPELKTLTRTMNAMVRRVRALLTQQAAELAELQQEALHDGVTGLLQRRYFLARLSALRATSSDAAQRLLASVAQAQQQRSTEHSEAAFRRTQKARRSGTAKRQALAPKAAAPLPPAAQGADQPEKAAQAALSRMSTATAETPANDDETQLLDTQVLDAQAPDTQFLEPPRAEPVDTPTDSLPRAKGLAPSGPGLALVLLRVQEVDALNLQLGREAVDQLLRTIALALEPYVDRVEGCFAGRLNGCDFALCLPVAGVAEETARALHEALSAAPVLVGVHAQVAVGAVDVMPDVGSSEALALADEALARAESGDGWFVVAPPPGPQAAAIPLAGTRAIATGADASRRTSGVSQGRGSQIWRSQIAQALAENRAELTEFVVVDRHRQLVHLECPLRVQLSAGEDYQPAARWLALARRSRLLPQVDLKALELALKAIGQDQQARAIHVSWPSLAAPGFAGEVTRRLRQASSSARLLTIEWGQSARPADWVNLAMATQSWRDLGVNIGSRHALAQPQQLVSLQELGIDHVKVDPQHLLGVATDEEVATYVKALVRLIHGLGAKAFAGGVTDEQDLQALWDCGFDTATGPAATAYWGMGKTSAGAGRPWQAAGPADVTSQTWP
jgi:EAL domain-containing protein (putative c-di-GMP-specific phosphodiesterase class I)/GGDEF domain-containing protein